MRTALHVCLDDDVQLLERTGLQRIEQRVERDLFKLLELLFLGLLLSLLDQLTRQTLVGNGVERIARLRHVRKTGDLNRHAGACLLDGAAAVIGHHTHTTHGGTGHDHVAALERAVLHQQRRHRASALVQTRFDHDAARGTVGVGLELLHFRHKQNGLQELVDIHMCLGGDGHADRVAAPLFGNQLVLGQLLHDAVDRRAFLIHLVDRHDDRNACRLGMVDRLDRLWHDAVVGRNDQHGNVRRHGAAGAHGGERRVTGRVEERDILAVQRDAVCADVLRDAAGLGGCDGRVADRVEDRGLAVVDVAHDDHDRIARLQDALVVLAVVDDALFDRDDDFLLDLGAHFGRNQLGRIKVDHFVDRRHHTQLGEHLFDDLRCCALEHGGQLADGELLGHLDDKLRLLGALGGNALQALRLGLLARTAAALAVLLRLLLDLLLALRVVALHGASGRRDGLVSFVVFVQIDVAAAARVHGAGLALRSGLRLAVVVLRLFLRRLLRLLRGLPAALRGRRVSSVLLRRGSLLRRGRFRLRGLRLCFSRFLRLFFGFLFRTLLVLQRKVFVKAVDLMLLRERFKNHVQLRLLERGHVFFLVGEIFCQKLQHDIAFNIEILGDFMHSVFIDHTLQSSLMSS